MLANTQIRRVGVEFLRGGPPHNQLLSPLTQYLAVCGDQSAGLVTVPYEHARFQRRLEQLRDENVEQKDRVSLMHEIGSKMGEMLGAVPGLAGALMFDAAQPSTLVHLRITLSASELALLPFEMAKVPDLPTASAERWLGVQMMPPVCITRSIRSVAHGTVAWPVKPRVLYVTGDPDRVPWKEHLLALREAVRPFVYPGSADADVLDAEPQALPQRQAIGDVLTVLINPSLSELLQECSAVAYTHVHFLMHGGECDDSAEGMFGLVFGGAGTEDVVSGERLATAIEAIDDRGVHRPTVVTLAACDSGNVGTVIVPGASVAHALHQAGVPLVVASQFPLSVEASAPLTQTIYTGLLRGDHPILCLHQVRAQLHARYSPAWHDWAGLVVYEALPQDMDQQIDTLKFEQARRAINASLQRLDLELQRKQGPGDGRADGLKKKVDEAIALLPKEGRYSIECCGLRASSLKRLAQIASTATRPGDPSLLGVSPCDLLEDAAREYEQGYKQYLASGPDVLRRVSTLHWLLVQHLSLNAVLARDSDRVLWEAARLAAEMCLERQDERPWAYGSLIEVWALGLLHAGLTPEKRQEYRRKAIDYARDLARLSPALDPFTITSTRRQFVRYREWWASEAFVKELGDAGARDSRKRWRSVGLLDTAAEIIAELERAERPARGLAAVPAGRTPAASARIKPGKRNAEPETTARSDAGGQAPPVLSGLLAAADLAALGRVHAGAFFDIEMVPAEHGDAIWIEYGEGPQVHRWLIDCGPEATGPSLVRRVQGLPKRDQLLELFVMSHIDADHIGGARRFFSAFQSGLQVNDVWFNGWRHLSGVLGAVQGEMFSTAIEKFELPWNAWRDGNAIVTEADKVLEHVLPGGMKITLLSPAPAQLRKLVPGWRKELKKAGLTPGSRVDYRSFLKRTPSTSTDVKELAEAPFASDDAAANGASIAVLAEYGGASALLAADAHPAVLAASIRTLLKQRGASRLKLDAFKVAHHASQNNLSTELLGLLDCQRYLVSTNGNYFFHPDREAIARIIQYGGERPQLYFNYVSRYNEVWQRPDLQEKYGYTAMYPEAGRQGMTVSLLATAQPAAV